MRICQKLFCHNCWFWWCFSSFKFSIFAILEIYINQVLACSDLNNMFLKHRAVASSIIGGGGLIFIYSCSAQLISFEIDCFYGV